MNPVSSTIVTAMKTNNQDDPIYDVGNYFQRAIRGFSQLKGKRKCDFPIPFWDVVALTTADEDQKECVMKQIDLKLKNKELPLDIPYVVVSDPPGSKIGSGGATFLILQELLEIFGSRMFELKILLIHTGGQCQRLPCQSVLGKLFSFVPIGNSLNRLLDIKLAMYQPFVSRMKPGFFVTASDDIETFYLDEKDPQAWTFEQDGFTALAHPSSTKIGSTHGVYILPPDQLNLTEKACFMSPCLRVLQKPSLDVMRETGAIYIKDIKESGDCKEDNEYVLSDSAYFFTHSVSRILLSSITTLKPYQVQSDCYGDFLQPLGQNSSKTYINSKQKSPKTKFQKSLFNLLKDVPLQVLVLNRSKFYHLGTMPEYVYHLTSDHNFLIETNLQKWSFSRLKINEFALKRPSLGVPSLDGIVMHSYLASDTELGSLSVVECCDIESPILMKSGILSYCQLQSSVNNKGTVVLPGNLLWHTAAVYFRHSIKYVTIVFDITDSLKESFPKEECDKLVFLGKDLKEICPLLAIKDVGDLFELDNSNLSIWQLEIFPIRSTRDHSFRATLSMVNRILKPSDNELTRSWLTTPRMSMETILDNKCISDMLNFQLKLKEKITEEV